MLEMSIIFRFLVIWRVLLGRWGWISLPLLGLLKLGILPHITRENLWTCSLSFWCMFISAKDFSYSESYILSKTYMSTFLCEHMFMNILLTKQSKCILWVAWRTFDNMKNSSASSQFFCVSGSFTCLNKGFDLLLCILFTGTTGFKGGAGSAFSKALCRFMS